MFSSDGRRDMEQLSIEIELGVLRCLGCRTFIVSPDHHLERACHFRDLEGVRRAVKRGALSCLPCRVKPDYTSSRLVFKSLSPFKICWSLVVKGEEVAERMYLLSSGYRAALRQYISGYPVDPETVLNYGVEWEEVLSALYRDLKLSVQAL